MATRLRVMMERMVRRPEASFPGKLVSRTELVGGYRMLNNHKVTPQGLLEAHRRQCLGWLASHPGKMLLLHDTTVLDYSGLNIPEMGQIGDGNGRGWYAHNSLLIQPCTRHVVGLMGQILHRRGNVKRNETRAQRAARGDRESRLWKDAVADLPDMPSGVRVIDVSDRGSDITEYIAHEIKHGREFIVRSQHNRVVLDDADEREDQKLHEQLRALAPAARFTIENIGETRRSATIGVAYRKVRLAPPRQPRGDHDATPLEVWALIAREIDPPEQVEPIEWMLLTNVPIDGVEAARECVSDYACRWIIEEYHKGMKSGCGIEDVQMTTAHGLHNAIALLSVLAVHVLRLRCKARDESTAQQLAKNHEEPLKVKLVAEQTKVAHYETMTVWEFYIGVARLGGYVANPKKRPPGWQILWRGYTRLEDMAAGARLWRERCVQT